MPGKQESSTERVFLATENPLDDSKVDVVLPDMFRLFLSEPPRVNPHYDQVKSESEAWFSEFVSHFSFPPILCVSRFVACLLLYPFELFPTKDDVRSIRKCHLDARLKRILDLTDFSYFCAVVSPDAEPLQLRTMCDWGNWVCFFLYPHLAYPDLTGCC